MATRRTERLPPRIAAIAALTAMAAVLAGDIAYGSDHVIVTGLMIGPMLAVLSGSRRLTDALAVLAVALALASGVWNDNLGESVWLIRALIVALGAVAAALTARARESEGEQLASMRLLADLGEVARDAGSVEDTARRIAGVLAPGFADAAAVDAVRGDGHVRVVAGEAALLGGEGPAIEVPLETRGGTRGTLTVASGGRAFGEGDREFLAVAAGRAALALDNAGLSSELTIVERRLVASLETLAEAVTVQDADGRLVYANEAAVALLGYPTAAEVVAQSGRRIVQEFDTTHADGRPLDVDELPGRRVLAGEEPEPLLVRVWDPRAREERWRVVKASGVRDDAGKVRYAVNVIDDVTEVKRAELTQRLLAQASRTLAGSLDPSETLQSVAEVGVPDLARWCTVHVPAASGALELVGVAGADASHLDAVREIDALADVLSSGAPQIVPEIAVEVLQDAGMRSAMVVPMQASGRTIGAITYLNSAERRAFDAADLRLAVELAQRAASAAENARLYAQQAHIATTLQADLVPPELPELPGWSVATLYRPAGEGSDVGGDFYDAFEVEDGWIVVVGDVAGRGPAAASLTAMARYTLRTAATLSGNLESAVELLNRTLYERPRTALCSACLLHLHGGDRLGEVSMVAAGHPDPYVVRDGEARAAAVGGPLLGALSRGDWPVVRLRLWPGDTIVVYTDGVIDTVGSDDRFGEGRLAATLAEASGAADAIERVDAALDAFASGRARDDTAMLALERAGERGPGTAEDRHRMRLPADPTAPALARKAVGDWLEGVFDEERMAAVRLLVSELVTNGVVHGTRRAGDGLDLELVIASDRVRLEVRNPGPGFTPGRERPVPAEARGGRGLLLVRRLADRWGAERGDRTCVWFELAR